MSLNINYSTRNYLELKGEYIYLKKLDPEYAEEYWETLYHSSIESVIFTGTQQIFGKSDTNNYLQEISSDRSRVDFLICSKETDKILGEVVINDIYRNNRSASLRIVINNKEDYNKGYGTESIILALNYAFGMLNLHRIELEVFPYNERAYHVYEKIGFIKEGVRRDGCFFNHKYYDTITMSILEDEFRNRYQINDKKLLEDLES